MKDSVHALAAVSITLYAMMLAAVLASGWCRSRQLLQPDPASRICLGVLAVGRVIWEVVALVQSSTGRAALVVGAVADAISNSVFFAWLAVLLLRCLPASRGSGGELGLWLGGIWLAWVVRVCIVAWLLLLAVLSIFELDCVSRVHLDPPLSDTAASAAAGRSLNLTNPVIGICATPGQTEDLGLTAASLLAAFATLGLCARVRQLHRKIGAPFGTPSKVLMATLASCVLILLARGAALLATSLRESGCGRSNVACHLYSTPAASDVVFTYWLPELLLPLVLSRLSEYAAALRRRRNQRAAAQATVASTRCEAAEASCGVGGGARRRKRDWSHLVPSVFMARPRHQPTADKGANGATANSGSQLRGNPQPPGGPSLQNATPLSPTSLGHSGSSPCSAGMLRVRPSLVARSISPESSASAPGGPPLGVRGSPHAKAGSAWRGLGGACDGSIAEAGSHDGHACDRDGGGSSGSGGHDGSGAPRGGVGVSRRGVPSGWNSAASGLLASGLVTTSFKERLGGMLLRKKAAAADAAQRESHATFHYVVGGGDAADAVQVRVDESMTESELVFSTAAAYLPLVLAERQAAVDALRSKVYAEAKQLAMVQSSECIGRIGRSQRSGNRSMREIVATLIDSSAPISDRDAVVEATDRGSRGDDGGDGDGFASEEAIAHVHLPSALHELLLGVAAALDCSRVHWLRVLHHMHADALHALSEPLAAATDPEHALRAAGLPPLTFKPSRFKDTWPLAFLTTNCHNQRLSVESGVPSNSRGAGASLTAATAPEACASRANGDAAAVEGGRTTYEWVTCGCPAAHPCKFRAGGAPPPPSRRHPTGGWRARALLRARVEKALAWQRVERAPTALRSVRLLARFCRG